MPQKLKTSTLEIIFNNPPYERFSPMNFGNILVVAAILSQTGGLCQNTNHQERFDETPCYVPSCSKKTWIKADIEMSNRKGGSIRWCTQIPSDEKKSKSIAHEMYRRLDTVVTTHEQLTETGMIAVLESVLESYCNTIHSCPRQKDCTLETETFLFQNRYRKPLKEKRSEKNLHVSRGRGQGR